MLGFSVIVSMATALYAQYSHGRPKCGAGCNEAWAMVPLSTIVAVGVGVGVGVWLLMVIGAKMRLGERLLQAIRRVLAPATRTRRGASG